MKADIPKRPLRVAHVINEPFCPDGASGVQQAVYCLAQAQAQLSNAVAVFSREGGVHVVSDDGVVSGGRSSPSPGLPKRSWRETALSGYFEARLAGEILRWKPAIVHFHSVHIPQNVALAGFLRRAGVPYCVSVHGALFDAALRRGRVKKRIFRSLFEHSYLQQAAFIHALSPQEVVPIRAVGLTTPIVIAPNGLPPLAKGPKTDVLDRFPNVRNKRMFLFCGRLDIVQKGLDVLVGAFARAHLHEAALMLVGPAYRGSDRMLTALAERLGVSSQVVLPGPAFGSELAGWLGAADVFVHPSRWEGISLSVLAASAASRPCLITRAADPLGALEAARAAVLVEPRMESLTEALRRMAALSRQELQSMGARAREVVTARFNWSSSAASLVQAYCDATATPSAQLRRAVDLSAMEAAP